MTGDEILDEDHIARYCSPKHVDNGEIQASAFHLGEGKDNLSVNWLEFLNCPNRNCEIIELQKIYKSKLTVKNSGRIIVLNVGDVRKRVKDETKDNRILRVIHKPESNDQSHSEVCNMKEDNELIAEIILGVVKDVYPAR